MYPTAELTERLHQFLQQQSSAVAEYQLIQVLEREGAFAVADMLSASVRLFHKHFVTMHCLYRLQRQVYPQRLDISPLAIRLHQAGSSVASDSALSDESGSLANYYLDLDHLYAATEDSVSELLTQFWQRFDGREGVDGAYAILGLSPSADWLQVKEAYRQKVQKAHPDKGGSSASFAEVREAYQVLKQHLQ